MGQVYIVFGESNEMTELLDGLITTIIGAIIIALFTYLLKILISGNKKHLSIFKSIRLFLNIRQAGVINFFPSRKIYSQHKDHGSQEEYINNRCTKSLLYVGYWLAHGTSVSSLVETIQKLVLNGKKVILILINPENNSLIEVISKFLDVSAPDMINRIYTTHSLFKEMKSSLPQKSQCNLYLKFHDIPLNSSALLFDFEEEEKCKILVDYKTYGFKRDKSYGIEYFDPKKELFKLIRSSFLQINDEITQNS